MNVVVRPSKTTKEMLVGELEQLKKPEARETAAFDPTELQGLIAASRAEDDLALPVEPAPAPAASNVTPMPQPASELDDVPSHSSDVPESSAIPPRMARGSAQTPKAQKPLVRPRMPRTPISLTPWIVVALAAAMVIALALWR